jgi:hypothetical protein
MAPSKLMWESPLTPLDSMVEAMLFSNSIAIVVVVSSSYPYRCRRIVVVVVSLSSYRRRRIIIVSLSNHHRIVVVVVNVGGRIDDGGSDYYVDYEKAYEAEQAKEKGQGGAFRCRVQFHFEKNHALT